LEAYTKVHPNLIKHDLRYPTPEYLRARTLLGNVKAEGEMDEVTAGSQHIVKILLDDTVLLNSNINSRNLNSESYGLYQWVWDTSGEEGIHTLTAILDPNDAISAGDEIIENNTASLDFVVHSRSELTEIESSAAWVTSSNDCCNVHVVSGTAAHRDLDELLEIVDSAFAQASTMLDEPLQGPYDVFLIDRVIGQGGYASGSMVVSYLDRDYAGSGRGETSSSAGGAGDEDEVEGQAGLFGPAKQTFFGLT